MSDIKTSSDQFREGFRAGVMLTLYAILALAGLTMIILSPIDLHMNFKYQFVGGVSGKAAAVVLLGVPGYLVSRMFRRAS